ncbi:small subunit ribosomal protein S35, partial [Phenoliferia sp. Uapishka_3]
MLPTARRLMSTSAKAAAKPRGGANRDGPRDPMDVMGLQAFDFPLTRDTILKLETRRQFLHYLRLEQYQFKDLVQFRKSFHKPTAAQVVKVRHQHYQGEVHPADRKVSVTFPVSRLPLSSDAARHKFKLIAGPRWDSDKDEVKIACELFPTDRMNEKWCSDVLDKMIKEAEDTTDSMADIPLDTRPTDARRKGKRIVTLRDYPSEWLPRAEGAKAVEASPNVKVASEGAAVPISTPEAPAP